MYKMFFKIIYPIILAGVASLGWFGMALPALISAKSDELPLVGILATPLVIALVVWLILIAVKSVTNKQNKKDNK
jgi:protein-S-isoprenylcysteine O-methyltransferase Ste14